MNRHIATRPLLCLLLFLGFTFPAIRASHGGHAASFRHRGTHGGHSFCTSPRSPYHQHLSLRTYLSHHGWNRTRLSSRSHGRHHSAHYARHHYRHDRQHYRYAHRTRSRYGHPSIVPRTSIFIIHPAIADYETVPVLLTFGVIDRQASPEAIAEQQAREERIARLVDSGWKALHRAEPKRAFTTFAAIRDELPPDGYSETGYALAAALEKKYHTAAFLMRQAFNNDPLNASIHASDPTLRRQLERLAVIYEVRSETYGDGHTENQFMLGAMHHLLGDYSAAVQALEDAVAANDRNPSTHALLQRARDEAALQTLLADNSH